MWSTLRHHWDSSGAHNVHKELSSLTKMDIQNASYNHMNAIPTLDSSYLLRPHSRTDRQIDRQTDSQLPPIRRGTNNR